MNGRTNRTRGFNLEREIVNAAKAKGLTSRRMWGSDGRVAGLAAEVDVIIENDHLQCKRRRALPKWIDFTSVNGMVIRADKQQAIVVLPLEHYLFLQQLIKQGSSGE